VAIPDLHEQQVSMDIEWYNASTSMGTGHSQDGGITMHLTQIQSYDDLERYLREFVNILGDPLPYDFTGAAHLFLAILDNLRIHALDAELEDIGGCFSVEQAAFLHRLNAYVAADPSDPPI